MSTNRKFGYVMLILVVGVLLLIARPASSSPVAPPMPVPVTITVTATPVATPAPTTTPVAPPSSVPVTSEPTPEPLPPVYVDSDSGDDDHHESRFCRKRRWC